MSHPWSSYNDLIEGPLPWTRAAGRTPPAMTQTAPMLSSTSTHEPPTRMRHFNTECSILILIVGRGSRGISEGQGAGDPEQYYSHETPSRPVSLWALDGHRRAWRRRRGPGRPLSTPANHSPSSSCPGRGRRRRQVRATMVADQCSSPERFIPSCAVASLSSSCRNNSLRAPSAIAEASHHELRAGARRQYHFTSIRTWPFQRKNSHLRWPQQAR